MTLLNKISDLIESVRNGLIYDTNGDNLKTRLFDIYDNLNALKASFDGAEAPAKRKDRVVILPAFEAFDDASNRYFMAPMRTLFMIGDFITESKILAIKEVRNLDNLGLKDSKDYVDGLQKLARDAVQPQF